MDNRLTYLQILIVAMTTVSVIQGQNATIVVIQGQNTNTNTSSYCATTPRGKITWKKCEEAMNDFVGGDITSVFQGSNLWWWPSLTEQEVMGNCSIYKGVHDTAYMKRTGISPEFEQLLSDGFHEMMDYILCDDDGAAGYLNARVCLQNVSLRAGISDCFEAYYNDSSRLHYNALLKSNNDDVIHQNCDAFKVYQQCRIDVFTGCGAKVADWNNEAIIRYYDEYMDEVHCDIDPGLPTHHIIFIVLACVGGILFMFCFCFCCSRFKACDKDNEKENLFERMSKNKKKDKLQAAKKAQSNGVVNKGFQKDDVESGKTKQNGVVKQQGENGYYNMKELDNNNANERTEKAMSERPLDPIDEQDEHRDTYDRDRRDRDRDYDYRDSPRNPRRDSPRDSPRGYPRDYPPGEYGRDHYDRGRFDRKRHRSGPSYDDMVHARVHGGGPPPRDYNDIRSMMKPRGLHRY